MLLLSHATLSTLTLVLIPQQILLAAQSPVLLYTEILLLLRIFYSQLPHTVVCMPMCVMNPFKQTSPRGACLATKGVVVDICNSAVVLLQSVSVHILNYVGGE